MRIVERLQSEDSRVRYLALKEVCIHTATGPLKAQVALLAESDPYAYNRLQAVRILRAYWPDPGAVRALSSRVTDEREIAEAALDALADISDDTALQVLRKAYLAFDGLWLRLNVLKRMARAPLPFLLRFLKETGALAGDDPNIRAAAVSLLGRTRDTRLRSLFLARLADPNPRVRANALEAIARIATTSERSSIMRCHSKDPDNRVRANALYYLLEMGEWMADRRLFEMVVHANARFRASAAWVLGRLGRSRHHLVWLRQLTQDAHPLVASSASRAMGQLVLQARTSSPLRARFLEPTPASAAQAG